MKTKMLFFVLLSLAMLVGCKKETEFAPNIDKHEKVGSAISLTIVGSTSCHSPYTGKEPIQLRLLNGIPNYSYSVSFPCNYNPLGSRTLILRGIAGILYTDSKGIGNFIFNNNPNASYIINQNNHGWSLPAGTYEFDVHGTTNQYPNNTNTAAVRFTIL